MDKDIIPKISVILPVRNGSEFIKESLESILNQSFKDFELIIVDNFSSDDTVKIINSYKDSRIKLIINPEDLGLINSLNIGLKNAKGEYIARMDHDDIAMPNRFEEQVNFLNNNPSIIEVGTWAIIIDRYGKEIGARYPDYDTMQIKYNMIFGNTLLHSSLMIRRNKLMKIGGYSLNAKNVEDYDIHLKFLEKGDVSIIKKPLLKYRVLNNSMTNESESQKIMYKNTISYTLKNISRFIKLDEADKEIIEKSVLSKNEYPDFTFFKLLRSLEILGSIKSGFIKLYCFNDTEKDKIIKIHKTRLRLLIVKYLVTKYHSITNKKMRNTIKKINFNNLFIKWPRIFIYEKIRELTKKTFLRGIFFYKYPIVLTDKHGIRSIWYRWDNMSIEKLLSHRMFDVDYMAFKKILKEGDIAFDIGANIGLHTTIISKCIGKSGSLHSFEPVPKTFDLLSETTGLNHLYNTKIHNIAFLNKPGSMEMNVFDENNSSLNSFGHPIFGNVKPIYKEIVEVDTIDNFCHKNKINKINFMKVDVEGFEKNVFEGAKKMLSEGLIDIISFEISKIPLEGSGNKPKDIFDILNDNGYASYKYNEKNNKFEGPIKDSDEFYANYYASKLDLSKN